MQDSLSPYESSPIPEPQAPVAHAALKPTVLTVFGILHLVLAGIGVLMVFFTLLGSVFSSALSQLPGDEFAALQAVQAETLWVTLLGAGFAAILSGLLTVAGIKLLRGRRDALRWSNTYAGTSIATKMVTLVLTILVVLPATQRMMEAMEQVGDEAGQETMLNFTSTLTTALAVATPLLYCIYPLVTLVLLNRQRIKGWLATHGS